MNNMNNHITTGDYVIDEMNDLKRALIDGWYRLSNIASHHSGESTMFQAICEKYYGATWHDLELITDNDRIIDTIDYGTDSLTFEEFDKLMRSAIAQQETV